MAGAAPRASGERRGRGRRSGRSPPLLNPQQANPP
ncbi:hypothetical protein RLOC_00004592 [Lonchura striata]|uniref:Uncharacterized protein n=1 Tax=Lonchura striata TaxID=40157 RepID=A0A218U947_9PASE|nr:hypothetical protein RLOC_00004592 [Lonchura striata domestica]